MSKKSTKKGPGIVPLGDRVLLEELENVEKTTAAGIILPDTVEGDKETKRGKVVAVGEGQMVDGKLEKPSVKEGDTVLYSWGDPLTVDGKNYVIVGFGNITAIIK